jgi:isopentenyl-diphosphate delta-isomerase
MELEQVILVDEEDKVIGTMGKLEAHQKAALHRAFSIFLFNKSGEMLLQQRAAGKYHSPGLWTNACCSHPRPGEQTSIAASRRLKEELGAQAPLKKIFDFIYSTHFENGLSEYEFDHVFTGQSEGPFHPDAAEIMDTKFISMDSIQAELETNPGHYTSWFHIAFPRVYTWWAENLKPAGENAD